jgi:hypothetical protein
MGMFTSMKEKMGPMMSAIGLPADLDGKYVNHCESR